MVRRRQSAPSETSKTQQNSEALQAHQKASRAWPRRAHLGRGQVQQRVGAVGHEDLQRAGLQQVPLVVHLACQNEP